MTSTQLLKKLIQIPSVNPDNTPGTDKTGEQAIADYLQPWLEHLGFTVTQEEIKPKRPNLIARAPGCDNRPRICLAPHLDTVGVGNMTIDPFAGDVRDGKIWGRGASDTKGPMVAMLKALEAHKDQLAELPIAVDFVAFMGEESSQHGSIHFGKHHGSEYEFAIAGEPTSLNVVYVTKGSLWATLATHGKAAHSSQPHLGENAIMSMARSLDMLNRKLTNRLATYTHNVLGHSTLNIGTISGGSRPNIVPDYCEAQIDIRLTPSLHDDGGALSLLQQVIGELRLPVEIIRSHENPPMETDAKHRMIQTLLDAREETTLVGAPWFSDAAHLSNAGVPSVCMGPGSIDQAHTKDEFISIADLEAGVDYFSNFISSLRSI